MHNIVKGILLLVLLLPSLLYAQALDRTHVNYVNPLQYGATCTAATLNSTLTAIGASQRTLILTATDRAKVSCTWTLEANVTVPVNVTVYIPTGIHVTINTGITLTLANVPLCDTPNDCIVATGTLAFSVTLPVLSAASYVTEGCLPTVPASSLTFAAFACEAQLTVAGIWNVPVQQAAASVTLANTNGIHWLAVCRDTSSVVTGWTRVTATHYIHQQSATQPATPQGCLLFNQVTVAASVITAVSPLAQTIEFPLSTVTSGTHIHAGTEGVRCDNVRDDTQAIQRLIDRQKAAGGGTVLLPRGTCKVDTIHMDDFVTLQGSGKGQTILSHIAHTVSHRPVVRIGDAGDTSKGGQSKGAVTGAVVRDLSIDGNRASQVVNEFSPGVMIWGSDKNRVENVEIYDVSGDGITIGYDTERQLGSNYNVIQHNEIYDVHSVRQGVAITWGNGNQILYNQISDFIDIEPDPNLGEAKHNIVSGNTGRILTLGQTAILNSDLGLAVVVNSTDPADKARFFGNVFSNNVAYTFQCLFGVVTTFTGNVLVGSNATQTYLMQLDACDDTIIVGNNFIAHSTTATSLVALLRTRATSQLIVSQNNINNGTIAFHEFISTFLTEPAATNQRFIDNIASGVGDYRKSSSTTMATESSVYKMTTDGATPQVFTFTLISGPPVPLTGASGGGVGKVANVDLGFASGAGFWRIELLGYGKIGATTEPWTHTCIYVVDEIGSTRAIEVWCAPLAGAAPTYVQYDFNSAGTIGALFFRVYY